MDMRERHSSRPVRLQQLFVVLVIFCMLSIILLELLYTRSVPQIPKMILQKTYMSARYENRRMGNAMFIYASLVGIANRTDVSVVMPKDFRLLKIFSLSTDVTDDVNQMLPDHVTYGEYGRRASAYDVKTEHLQKQNTILDGYFQSWKYFRNIKQGIASQFTFKPSIHKTAKSFLEKHVPSAWQNRDFVRVGIHVRRGDTLNDYYKNYGYTTADAAYFERAISYFKERFSNVQFVVCSDDIAWAKQNIRGDFIIYSEGQQDFEDMAILSHCDHVIVSTGSFGWWSAWLANGTTIYYKKWPKEYSKLEYHVDKKAYFPEHWISM